LGAFGGREVLENPKKVLKKVKINPYTNPRRDGW